MYSTLLAVHNIVRWVVVISGVVALVRALWGMLGKRDWVKADRTAGLVFSISVDVQLLLGLLLYFVYSPLTKAAFQDFGAAMGDSVLRFFSLEHAFYMLLAVVFVHLGGILPRKVEQPGKKHQRALIFFLLAVSLILLGIPWARPLFPGLS